MGAVGGRGGWWDGYVQPTSSHPLAALLGYSPGLDRKHSAAGELKWRKCNRGVDLGQFVYRSGYVYWSSRVVMAEKCIL